jgi:uncharacterized membrane protein
MSKDVLTTVIGMIMAAAVGAKEYVAMQNGTEDVTSWQFLVGMASAVLVAVFGYWSKRGE